MTRTTARRFVTKQFGAKQKFTMKGEFALVHLDNPSEDVCKSRFDTFDHLLFFDPKCEHCRPFIEKGSYMLWLTSGELIGMRPLRNGAIETVLLKEPYGYSAARKAKELAKA